VRVSKQSAFEMDGGMSPTRKHETAPKAETGCQSEHVNKQTQRFLLMRTLGKGSFGKVKLGLHTPSGEYVAVKILEKAMLKKDEDIVRLKREIDILRKARHPHIVQLYETVETENYHFFVMEYAELGELSEYIESRGKLSEDEARRFFGQLLLTVKYLHSIGCAHRDIKPSNILLDWKKNVKLIDFGLGNLYGEGQKLSTSCGSPCYAAPELISGEEYCPLKVDIWSSGITLYAMLCGYLPFEEESKTALYDKILACRFPVPRFISSNAADLLRAILVREAVNRPTVEDLLMHPWMQGVSTAIPRDAPLPPIELPLIRLTSRKSGIDEATLRGLISKGEMTEHTMTYHLLAKRKLRADPEILSELDNLATQELEELKRDLARVPHAPKKKQKVSIKPESNSRKPSKTKKQSQVMTAGVKTRFEMKRTSAPPAPRKKSKDNNKSTLESITPESLGLSLKVTSKPEETATIANIARRGSQRMQEFKKSINPAQTLSLSTRMPSIPILQLSTDNQQEQQIAKANSLSRRKEGFFKSKELFSKTLGVFPTELDNNISKQQPSAPEQTKNLLAKLLGKLNTATSTQKASKKKSELDKSNTARESCHTRHKTSSLNATSKLFRTQNPQSSNLGNLSLTIDMRKALQNKTMTASGRGYSPPSRAGHSFLGAPNMFTPKPSSETGNYFLPLGVLGSMMATTRPPPKISGMKLRIPLNKTLNTSGQRDHSRRVKD
jgi:serine/threonine protein kinase